MKWWPSRSVDAWRGALVLVLGLALFHPAAEAQTRPALRIVVETPHLGAGPRTARIRAVLPRLVAAELGVTGADLVPPGGRMVIRLVEVFLANAEPSEDFGGLSVGDAIDGEVLILDQKGRLISRRPVAARSPVSAGGFGPIMVTEIRRIDALMETLAYWIARGR